MGLWISPALDQVDAMLAAGVVLRARNYTKPVYPAPSSAQIPYATGSKIRCMDALAIVLGVAMFAILFGLIYAIDRV
ncbi:MAG: hypothetical protein ACRDL5_14530 [Solirubrobacteraceae bacterium]